VQFHHVVKFYLFLFFSRVTKKTGIIPITVMIPAIRKSSSIACMKASLLILGSYCRLAVPLQLPMPVITRPDAGNNRPFYR